jgi:N-acetylmuramoyl-L-alanine amidase
VTIAVDIGHNAAFDGGKVGVKGFTEDQCAKKVGTLVKAKLKAMGYQVVDCSPVNSTSLRNSLKQRTDKANAAKADYFVSIHFNASPNGKGKGTEVYYRSEEGKKLAASVQSQITSLGFVSRGIKYNSTYYVMRKAKMTPILIECAFVDSASDMKKFNAESMANAICRGLNSKLNPAGGKPVLRKGTSNKNAVKNLQSLLGIKSDGVFGAATEKAVRNLQKELGLIVDGVVGQQTWTRLLK